MVAIHYTTMYETLTPITERFHNSITFYFVRNNGYVERKLAELKDQGIIIKTLQIAGDWIDSLEVPEGVETLIAIKLGLKKIPLPKSLKQIYIDDNFLTEIRLPKDSKAILLEASRNYIEHFICEDGRFPDSLKTIKLKHNRLRELLYPKHNNLWLVDIRYQNQFITKDKIHHSLFESDGGEYEFKSGQFENNMETHICS